MYSAIIPAVFIKLHLKKYVVLPYSNIEKLEIQGGVAYNEDKLLKGKGIFMPVPRGLL